MRWSEVGMRLYLGGGEWGRVDPLTGAVRGTDQTDYYRYSGDGELVRVPWKNVYEAVIQYKERLIRRFEKRYGNNAKLEVTPPYMTNNIFINRPCCHNSSPPPAAPAAPAGPPAVPRRCSTSSSSSTKTVYLTQEEVMLFHRYFDRQTRSDVDVDRLVNDQEYMSSVLMCWNPLVHVRRSNLERLRQKIQTKRRKRERKHSVNSDSDFDPNTYKTIQNRKRESHKRKRDTDSDSEDIPLRKSPRVNKIVSESDEEMEKENLSLKEFAATLGLKENSTDDTKSKENVRSTRNSFTKHNRMNGIENQRMIEVKRRMIERNKRRIREKQRYIRDNERVIQEKELFIRDNGSSDKSTRNNERPAKNNENSTKENEKSSKNNDKYTKQNEMSSKNNEIKINTRSTKENEDSSKKNEIKMNTRSTKENGTSSKSNENINNPKPTIGNEKSSKKNEKSTKDVGNSKDSESKILKEKNSPTTRSEEPRRKLKCRPPIQREYSPLEDHTIVSLVSVGGRSRRVSGNALWRDLVEPYQRIANVSRTWQSLRNRYLRYILPNLGSLHLELSLQSALRADAARGAIKRKGARASILHTERTLPAASTRNKIPSKTNVTVDYDEPSTSKAPTPRKSLRIDDSSRKPPRVAETPRQTPRASELSRLRGDSSSPELIIAETRQSSIKKYLTRNSTSNEDKQEKSTAPRRRQLYNPKYDH